MHSEIDTFIVGGKGIIKDIEEMKEAVLSVHENLETLKSYGMTIVFGLKN